jgi:hypothetical protein
MQKREITRALVSAGVLTALLGGCGGGGGSTESAKAPDTVAVTTRVVDGPLKNAVVCLDANGNGACDSGEVQGTTDVDGRVTLQVAPGDVGKYPIIAIVGTDAVDKDNGAVTTRYVLKAPADQTAMISPLTSLVQAHVEATGASTSAAADFVKTQAGLSVSPLADFSASSSAGSAQAATVARLVVLTTQEQSAAVQAVVGQQDLSGTAVKQTDVDRVVATTVLGALPAVAAAANDPAVAAATDKNAALAAAAKDLVTNQTGLDASTALATIGVAKLPIDTSTTSTASASAALRSFTFTDANNWSYRSFESTAADNTPDANGLIHYYEIHKSNAAGTIDTWGYGGNKLRTGDLHWNGSAWVGCAFGFRNSQYPRDAQGRTTYNYCDGFEKGISTRSSIDISGLTLASVVADKIRTFPGNDNNLPYSLWGPANPAALGTATFPAGSKLYYNTNQSLETAINYDVQSSNVVSSYIASVAAGGDARTGTPACGQVTSGNSASYQSQPTTLEDFVARNPGSPCIFNQATNVDGTSLNPNEWWSNSTASIGFVAGAMAQPAGTSNYYTTLALLRVAFGAGNTTKYFACLQRQVDGSTRNCTQIGSGAYTIQTLGDGRVMTFAGLPTLSQRMGYSRVFVERGGKIYYGYQNTAGNSSQGVRLNITATNAVFAQLGISPIVPN